MIERSVILGGRGTLMAAAALAASLSMMPPSEPRPIKRGRHKQNRPRKQADRSRKQYLLKGIRP